MNEVVMVKKAWLGLAVILGTMGLLTGCGTKALQPTKATNGSPANVIVNKGSDNNEAANTTAANNVATNTTASVPANTTKPKTPASKIVTTKSSTTSKAKTATTTPTNTSTSTKTKSTSTQSNTTNSTTTSKTTNNNTSDSSDSGSKTKNTTSTTTTAPATSGEDVWATNYLDSDLTFDTAYAGQWTSLFESLTQQLAVGKTTVSAVKSQIDSLAPSSGSILGESGLLAVNYVDVWSKNYSSVPHDTVDMNAFIGDTLPGTEDPEATYYYGYVYYNANTKMYTVAETQVGFRLQPAS